MRLKKRRGVFYTPARLAEILVAWSVRSSSDVVLEPSFGGCEFIAALQRRFLELGKQNPVANIYGCDVDVAAFRHHLPNAIGRAFNKQQFRKMDFLKLRLAAFPIDRFDAVVGNPPYVSYHNMFKTQRAAAASTGQDTEFRLSRMASLWAYFVFHSLKFLKEDGRMAWVLPGSLLHADYGKELLHELSWRFNRVCVISLSERVFLKEKVSESTEVLVCDGYRRTRSNGDVEIIPSKNVEQCGEILKSWPSTKLKGLALNGRAALALTRADQLSAFEQIRIRQDVSRLKDVARISIGIVTGLNRFFILDEPTALKLRLPWAALTPIFAKFGIAPGVRILSKDLVAAMDHGLKCLLLDGAKASQYPTLRSYFDGLETTVREKNITFKKRADWKCADDKRIPDAFLPYMHHGGPRLVLNECSVNATNTIHRVYFDSTVSAARRRLIAVSVLSTFSQLSAEIEGRTYGGGVLKHEPTEASRIQMILPHDLNRAETENLFRNVDVLLRKGCNAEATELVDEKILAAMERPPKQTEWKSMRATLRHLRERRLAA